MAETEAIATPLRVADVFPNPDQPRTEFPAEHIADLWASIAAEGLLQPISVTPRPKPDGSGPGFMIVAGECRWRAHVYGGAETIDALVRRDLDDQTVMVLAIIENARRRDVTPLEEAAAYQKCLDRGMTPEELARRLGLQQVWRITERTCLLRLRPEYQALLKAKQLGSSQAYEMAQLAQAGQDRLFALIRTGEVKTYDELRTAALRLREAEKVVSLFGEAARDKPTELEKRLARGLEDRFGKVVRALRASVVDNEVVALKKINPDRAGSLADLAREMGRELGRIEKALRAGAEPKPEWGVA